jgi:multiple sugar transport system substrate-binding protein
MARWSWLLRSLGLLLLITLLASSCSRTDADGKTLVRFSFWGNFMDLRMWRMLAEEFEAQNPDIKLKLEYISGDYHKKIQLSMISDNAADIILMDDEIFPAYSVRGYLEDLTPYLTRDAHELRLPDMFPTAMESFNYKGFQGGLPWNGLTEVIFFNKDMFDAAGIPYPAHDWTYDDFRRIARELTRDRDNDGGIDQFGAMLEFAFNVVQAVVWSFGGEIMNEDRTRFVMNSPEGVEAIQFMANMRCLDRSVPQSFQGEVLFNEVKLLTGLVGMVKAGSFLAITLRDVKDGMRWGMAPLPIGPRGDRYTRVSWDGISINARSRYKEEAWRFIKFVQSEQAQSVSGGLGRGLPVRVTDAHAYYVHPDSGVDEQIVIDAVYYGKLTPITPRYLEIFEAMRYELDQIRLCNQSAAAGLERLEHQVNAILQRELEQWGP